MVKNYGSTSKKYIYSRYTQDPKFQLWYQRLNHVWNVRWFSLVSPMDTHLIWVGPNNVNKKRPKVRGINEPIGFQKHEGHKSRLGWFRIETPNLLVTLVFKYIQISPEYIQFQPSFSAPYLAKFFSCSWPCWIKTPFLGVSEHGLYRYTRTLPTKITSFHMEIDGESLLLGVTG
jgi:hypothetical protein